MTGVEPIRMDLSHFTPRHGFPMTDSQRFAMNNGSLFALDFPVYRDGTYSQDFTINQIR